VVAGRGFLRWSLTTVLGTPPVQAGELAAVVDATLADLFIAEAPMAGAFLTATADDRGRDSDTYNVHKHSMMIYLCQVKLPLIKTIQYTGNLYSAATEKCPGALIILGNIYKT